MNTFGLHVCIVLAVFATVNCFPQEPVEQPQANLNQLLKMMEMEDNDEVAPENDFDLAEEEEQNEAEEEGFQNQFDRPLNVQCNTRNGEALSRVQSIYSAGHRDRKWEFTCTKVSDVAMSECKWTNYLNGWDQPLVYTCPQDFVMGGIISYHHNGKEDRRWRIKCCRAKGYQTESCELTTQYINTFRAKIDFEVHCAQQSSRRAFTGLYSYHDNRQEDRRWKVFHCGYDKA